MLNNNLPKLIEEALNGNELAIARLLTKIEYMTDEGISALGALSKRSGNAHVIGITGIPGAGKSTLIGGLIQEYVSRGHRVGVIVIDPSSPYTMGSFMGNRLRFQDKTMLKNVFVRSIGSRGYLGGISAEALMLTEALDGLGYDKIIIETVGAGQTDTEVEQSVHTILVVTIPGAGDDIQALKAGIMEIGDIYVLNKTDRPDAELTFNTLKFAIDSSEISYRDGWKPLIVKAVAIKNEGISEIVNKIEDHLNYLKQKELFKKRIIDRRAKIVELIARRKIDEIISEIVKKNYNTIINEDITEAVPKVIHNVKELLR
ncbi:LAO/AO transport system ATPase [Sulfolobus islandicus Y.G.57.14]|jgi:LAO/AO transport system kinase|uniref:LAO/AO transport system ATPase n=4 Tax=Saccharolobus islandicus TaxID=43080 RepID=C3MJF1_SACI2|nr:methylmalonyl Co-A mutase-associated GTPase MeaB [Sulfolobus islandicus]ACP34229.1 LAO/AO transport system ATPase [Sulfolobus islandicus L.S.2.15]ACP44370.1 LAO/AO transport system ATPase [Sulfolobus islandicus Y.G.57.14]ACP47273.1 LAO/AO transport system ATPase [Sulfolobus islandicus Y.N.15.51]ADB85879.1 LAO/AO transport system ATPase [Sulfolobus islandicus L.D.8.5]PVU78345.1 methylmalonyl Co-A mutase-associated GTPase MeaB [Sulfolobus islandicus]